VSRRRFALPLVACALAAAGCSGPEYDHTEITAVRPPPAPLVGSVTRARVHVSVGAVVTAHLVAYNDDRKPMSLALYAKDPSVVEVVNVVSEHDYAFLGLRPGVTEVELKADGDRVLVVTAEVVDQPAP
jgi:hypothetical protein